MSLLADVVRTFDAQGIRHALIGAAAMAVHGVSRSTLAIDLLTTDRRALDAETYGLGSADAVDVRVGDDADPLAGFVRIVREGERDVDVMVGRTAWQLACIDRAEMREVDGATVPVVSAADIVLLKLYTAGSQDARDIEQLLAAGGRNLQLAAIDQRINALPESSRELWSRLRKTKN